MKLDIIGHIEYESRKSSFLPISDIGLTKFNKMFIEFVIGACHAVYE